MAKDIPIKQSEHADLADAVQPYLKGFVGVIETLDKESPRGMVLTLTGFLEATLKKLLIAFLREGSSENDLFENNGPLSTFSARIRLSQALGLISDKEASSLHTIRNLRNDFAHEPGAAFDVPSIRDRASNLGEGESPRLRFQFAAVTLIIGIGRRIEHFTKNRRVTMDARLEATWEAMPEGPPPDAKLISRGGHD
jgi:hypothetical protein